MFIAVNCACNRSSVNILHKKFRNEQPACVHIEQCETSKVCKKTFGVKKTGRISNQWSRRTIDNVSTASCASGLLGGGRGRPNMLAKSKKQVGEIFNTKKFISIAAVTMNNNFNMKKEMWLSITQQYYEEVHVDKKKVRKLRYVWRSNQNNIRDKVKEYCSEEPKGKTTREDSNKMHKVSKSITKAKPSINRDGEERNTQILNYNSDTVKCQNFLSSEINNVNNSNVQKRILKENRCCPGIDKCTLSDFFGSVVGRAVSSLYKEHCHDGDFTCTNSDTSNSKVYKHVSSAGIGHDDRELADINITPNNSTKDSTVTESEIGSQSDIELMTPASILSASDSEDDDVNACLKEFNNETLSEYLQRGFDIVSGESSKQEAAKTIHHVCTAHMLKLNKFHAKKLHERSSPESSQVHIAMRFFGRLICCSTLEEMTNFVCLAHYIFISKYVCSKLQAKLDKFSDVIHDFANSIDQDIEPLIVESDNTVEGEVEDDPDSIASLDEKKNNVWIKYWNKKERLMEKNDRKCGELNKYFMPRYFNYVLKKYLPCCVLWSRLLLGDLRRFNCDYLPKTASSNLNPNHRNYLVDNNTLKWSSRRFLRPKEKLFF